MKKIISSLLLATLAAGADLAQAQSAATTIVAEFQGPGGHSSSNYGRTSALHAAENLYPAVPSAPCMRRRAR